MTQRKIPVYSPLNQSWDALLVFDGYRLLLAGIIFALNPISQHHLPETGAIFFKLAIPSYLGFATLALFFTLLRIPRFFYQALLKILTDIFFITIFIYLTGGIKSNFSLLFIVLLAIASLLTPGRLGYLYAAISTLIILSIESFDYLFLSHTTPDNLPYAAWLSILFFTIPALSNFILQQLHYQDFFSIEQYQALTQLEQLTTLLTQEIQTGVLVLDRTQRIQLINPVAQTLFDRSSKRVPNLPILLSDFSLPLFQLFKRWQSEDFSGLDIFRYDPHGPALHARFLSISTDTPNPLYLIFIEDFSNTLKSIQNNKLTTLGQLTASIAHEIRNPLAAIQQAADLLIETDISMIQKKFITLIQKNTRRTNRIVDSILALANPEPPNPKPLLLQAWLNQFVPHFYKNPLPTFEYHIDPKFTFHFDPTQLEQVLSNLIDNAIQHGQATHIQIQTQTHGTQKIINLFDNGIGIPVEQASYIFEPFFTTDSNHTGLGLYLAKKLCELNKTQLQYHNQSGTCFQLIQI